MKLVITDLKAQDQHLLRMVHLSTAYTLLMNFPIVSKNNENTM